MMLLKTMEYYDLLNRHEPIAIELGNRGLLGALYAVKGWCEWWFGHFDQAIETVSKAAELCRAEGDADKAAGAYMSLQWVYVCNGDFYKSIAFKENTLGMMEERFNLRTCVYAFCAALWAYTFLGRWDEAVEEGQAALRTAEEFSDGGLTSFAASSICLAYSTQGDQGQAIKYGELAVQKAPTPAEKFWAQGFLALAWCRAGEAHRGIESLINIVSTQRIARFKFGEIGFMGCLGEGYWLAGEYDKAMQTFQEGLELAENCGLKWWALRQHRFLGEIALKTNPDQVKEPFASPHFEQSISLSKEIKADNELALSFMGYGRLHKQQGNIAQARAYLSKGLELLERLGTLLEPEIARKELAKLSED
jgi:tetratricopeptide (TPR) repeat protein